MESAGAAQAESLIVSYPRSIPAGRVSQALVEYMGLYPVLADLAGIGPPRGIEARSFAALAQNPDSPGPDASFAEFAFKNRYKPRA